MASSSTPADIHGNTLYQAIQYFAHSGDAAFLLLPQRALLGVPNALGDTALHTAIAAGREEAALTLVRVLNRADLSTRNKEGHTPLHLAVRGGCVSVVRALLQHGADASVVDAQGNTPLHVACRGPHSSLVATLAEAQPTVLLAHNFEGLTPLHVAVQASHDGTLAALLAAANDCDVKDASNGRTPLHLAARLGAVPAVYALIQAGADVNARDYGVHTPLHVAAEANNPRVAEALVASGADVSLVNCYGQAALAVAHARGNVEVAGAILNTQPTCGLEAEWQMLSLEEVSNAPSSEWDVRGHSNARQARNMVSKMLRKGNKSGIRRFMPSGKKEEKKEVGATQLAVQDEAVTSSAAKEKKLLQQKYALKMEMHVAAPAQGAQAGSEKARLRAQYQPTEYAVSPNMAMTPNMVKAAEARGQPQSRTQVESVAHLARLVD